MRDARDGDGRVACGSLRHGSARFYDEETPVREVAVDAFAIQPARVIRGTDRSLTRLDFHVPELQLIDAELGRARSPARTPTG
jgi:hypothetical protein